MHKQSHRYDFNLRDLAGETIGPLLVIAAFAMILHLGVYLHIWPAPHPMWNMEQTLLTHQAEASRSPQSADLLLLGDSSCVMDVDAEYLQTLLPDRKVLDLGTFSFLDLDSTTRILREYVQANPGKLKTVVLLMHPESLRRTAPIARYEAMLTAVYDRRDDCYPETFHDRLLCGLGLTAFKGRVLSRILPRPLRPVYARHYGFTWNLYNCLSQSRGSLTAPGHYTPGPGQGNAEYRLAETLKEKSRRFSAAIPNGTTLLIGITPAPQSFVLSDYTTVYPEMLNQWAGWINADAVLAELPPTLPDSLFASTTHLDEQGVPGFTKLLAREIASNSAMHYSKDAFGEKQ